MIISTMSKPPLIELVVEIRFISNEPDNYVLGILERLAKKYSYTNVINLGLVHLPEEIRRNDPNLVYAPWYRIGHSDNPHLSCFIGPKVFSLSWSKQPQHLNEKPFFPGWSSHVKDIFLPIFSEVLEEKENFSISFENIIYRTIDIFEEGTILENSNFSLSLNTDNLSDNSMSTNLSFKKLDGIFSHTITISNSSKFNQTIPGSQIFTGIRGSSLDIITNCLIKNDDIMTDLMSTIQQCHDENKKVFSSIIKQEFATNELGAQYAN